MARPSNLSLQWTLRAFVGLLGCSSRLFPSSAPLELQPGHTLVPRLSFTDQLHERHTRLVHYFRGIRVWGSEAIIHLDPQGRRLPDPAPSPDLAMAEDAAPGTSLLRPLPIRLKLVPKLDPEQARQALRRELGPAGAKAVFHRCEEVIFPVYRSFVPERPAGRPLNAEDAVRVLEGHRLAWLVRTEVAEQDPGQGLWDCLVDARTGALLVAADGADPNIRAEVSIRVEPEPSPAP
jgi:hypothetical protein